MASAPPVLLDVAPVVGAEALYFGFSRGRLAAGGSVLELCADGRVRVTAIWRA